MAEDVVFRSVVVGSDGSDTAKRAVATATRLAKTLGVELHVVSAYNPLRAADGFAVSGYVPDAGDSWDALAREVVDEAVATARLSGVGVHGHAVVGDPVHALLEIAQRENADLIVVGSRGMHGIKRALGSVPNTVSHRAPCSVLIVSTDDPD